MSRLSIPLEQPKSEALRISFYALEHGGPVTVHTAISIKPGFEDQLNIENILSLGFQAQTELHTGDAYFLTNNILEREDWASIDPNITDFEFLQKSSVRNLRANIDDVVPLLVADYLVGRYNTDSADLASVISNITNSEVDDSDLRETISDVVEGVYNKSTAAAMIYATGELIAVDTRGMRSKAVLKNYNECLKTLGEHQIKSLKSIVSTEYLQSITGSIPDEGLASQFGKLPSVWPDLQVFHDEVGYELDSIDTLPIESVASELERLLPKIKDSDNARRAKNNIIALHQLADSAAEIKQGLMGDGFLTDDEDFCFEYFAGSIQLSCRDSVCRQGEKGGVSSPADLISKGSDQVKSEGSADLQLGAALYRIGWDGVDEIKKVSVKNFVSSFKTKHPDFTFRFYDELSPGGDGVLVLKLAESTVVSVPEAKRLPLDSVSFGTNIRDAISQHNEHHNNNDDVIKVDLEKNGPRINRADVQTKGRAPVADEPMNLANIVSLVRSDLSLEYGMHKSTSGDKARELASALVGGGLVVYAENRHRNYSKNVSSTELFESYNGNRRLAADSARRSLANIPGFSTGVKFRVYDALELTNPEQFAELDNLNQRGEAMGQAASEELQKGRDLGVVAGVPLKGLNKGNFSEVSEALYNLGYSDLKAMATKKSLWTVRQKERSLAAGVDPGVAYLELNYRNNFPAQCFDLSNQENIDFYVRSLIGLRDAFTEEGATMQSVENNLKEWHKEFFPLNIGRNWKASFSDTGIQEWSDCQRDMWIPETKGVAAYKPFVVAKNGSNPIQQWFKTAVDITWDELLKKSEVKKLKRISWEDLPHLSHLHRAGPVDQPLLDTRTSEEMLLEDFNFSGIEYGNWLNNKEADEHMWYAYTSMSDLATALDLPKRALSLGGSLGLAFGSRGLGGKGAAVAHFEPSNAAINLTRMKGAGSLGHEYSHALGNYFAKLVSPLGTDMFRGLSAGNNTVAELRKDKSVSGGMRPDLYKKWIQAYSAVMFKPSALKGAMQYSDFAASGKARDINEDRKSDYWGTPVELFARAMERYIDAKLTSHGITNNYLIRPERFSLGGGGLYPSDEEMEVIVPAIDGVFKEIELKEEQINHAYLGRASVPVMYSHDLGKSGVEVINKTKLASMAFNDIQRMLGDSTAISMTEVLRDKNNNAVAGAWDSSRNVIQLASSIANQDTINHEAFHAAESKLLTEREINMLDKHLQDGSPMYNDLVKLLDSKGLRSVVKERLPIAEERRAYAFQYFASGELKQHDNEVSGVLARLKELLVNIYSTLKGAGYTKPADLFNDLKAGELAHRSITSSFGTSQAAKKDYDLSLAV
jgi:hypothetical protein